MAIATRSLAVHESQHTNRCTVCKHPDKAEIEAKFLRFGKRYALEKEYGLPKDSLYRHAKYYDLYEKRDEKAALHRIIEHGMAALEKRPPSATNTIEAVKALAKLNGNWIDRSEDITLQLEKLTDEELGYWAKTGRMPDGSDSCREIPFVKKHGRLRFDRHRLDEWMMEGAIDCAQDF